MHRTTSGRDWTAGSLEVVRWIPHEAKTLEAAMGIEDLAARVVAEVKESRACLPHMGVELNKRPRGIDSEMMG